MWSIFPHVTNFQVQGQASPPQVNPPLLPFQLWHPTSTRPTEGQPSQPTPARFTGWRGIRLFPGGAAKPHRAGALTGAEKELEVVCAHQATRLLCVAGSMWLPFSRASSEKSRLASVGHNVSMQRGRKQEGQVRKSTDFQGTQVPAFAKLPRSPTDFCFLSFTMTRGTPSLWIKLQIGNSGRRDWIFASDHNFCHSHVLCLLANTLYSGTTEDPEWILGSILDSHLSLGF